MILPLVCARRPRLILVEHDLKLVEDPLLLNKLLGTGHHHRMLLLRMAYPLTTGRKRVKLLVLAVVLG